ncbi:hypothetical protein NE619_16700, partial [Anaerovorax odorimutans]|nr:hypothetical protein [Anaerovorax odorimutans]
MPDFYVANRNEKWNLEQKSPDLDCFTFSAAPIDLTTAKPPFSPHQSACPHWARHLFPSSRKQKNVSRRQTPQDAYRASD